MASPHPAAAALRSNEVRKGKRNIRKENPRSIVELNPKTSRFHVVNQENQFKGEFIGQFENDHLNIFIQKKDLKASILKTIPVPSNLQEVRRMDEFMAQILKQKRQIILLQQDAIYEKIQRKNMNVMEPLCKLWESLETTNKEQDSSVSINDSIKFVTQSMILVELKRCSTDVSVLWMVL